MHIIYDCNSTARYLFHVTNTAQTLGDIYKDSIAALLEIAARVNNYKKLRENYECSSRQKWYKLGFIYKIICSSQKERDGLIFLYKNVY